MKKFYYRRSLSQEETPILRQLERRHTLHNALADDVASKWQTIELKNIKTLSIKSKALRTGSTSHKSVGSDTTGASEVSTMVITDSDLASSWMYTTRKEAAVKESDADSTQAKSPESPSTPVQRQTSPEPDVESPQMHLKPIPLAPTDRRQKLWCYFLVLLVVCVCAFGILSSVGGIVYIEVFASKNVILQTVHQRNKDNVSIDTGTLPDVPLETNLSILNGITLDKDQDIEWPNVVTKLDNTEIQYSNDSTSFADLNSLEVEIDHHRDEVQDDLVDSKSSASSIADADVVIPTVDDLSSNKPSGSDLELDFKLEDISGNALDSQPGSDDLELMKKVKAFHGSVDEGGMEASKRRGSIDTSSVPSLMTLSATTSPMVTSTTERPIMDLQHHMSKVMRQFQSHISHPVSRTGDFGKKDSTRKTDGKTFSGSSSSEKERYLDNLRVKLFDSR